MVTNGDAALAADLRRKLVAAETEERHEREIAALATERAEKAKKRAQACRLLLLEVGDEETPATPPPQRAGFRVLSALSLDEQTTRECVYEQIDAFLATQPTGASPTEIWAGVKERTGTALEKHIIQNALNRHSAQRGWVREGAGAGMRWFHAKHAPLHVTEREAASDT